MQGKKARTGDVKKAVEGIGSATGDAVCSVVNSAAGVAETAVRAMAGGLIGGIAGAASGITQAIQSSGEQQAGSNPNSNLQSAQQYGNESRARFGNRPFDDVEQELRAGWISTDSPLAWEAAREAVRAAYMGVEVAAP